MRNKKANFTLTEFMKIILAVISIGLLLYLAVSLYGLLIKKTDMEQARASLEKLVGEIDRLKEGQTRSYIMESPRGWGVFYYNDVNSAEEYEDQFGLYYYFDGESYKNAKLECTKNCLCIMPFDSEEVHGTTIPGGVFSGITPGKRNAKVKEGICKSFDKPIKVSDEIKKILKINVIEIHLSKQEGVVNIK